MPVTLCQRAAKNHPPAATQHRKRTKEEIENDREDKRRRKEVNDEQLAPANVRLTDMEIGRAINNEEGTPHVNYLADSVAGPPRLRECQSIVSLSSGTLISL